MRQILIPTDFTSNSYNAIKYAFSFFRNEKTTFHFVQISDNTLKTDTHDLRPVETPPEFKLWLNKTRAVEQNSLHHFKMYAVKGSFITWLRSFVHEMKIEMIILASKGSSGSPRIPVGWHTREIITKVKCTIMVVPEKARFRIPINLGFPTDFNLTYKERFIESLEHVLEVRSMSVKIIRVTGREQVLNDFQNDNRKYFNERLDEVQHSFHILENRQMEDELQRFIDCLEIDMLAIFAKNLNFLKRLLFNEQDAGLRYPLEMPFLILHE